MADFNHGHATALVTSMLGTDKTIAELFDDVAYKKLATDHVIPTQSRSAVRQALTMGYAEYLREAKFYNLDVKKVGKELAVVAKAASALKSAITELSPDAVQAMNDFVLGSSLSEQLPHEETLKDADPALLIQSMLKNDATATDYGFDVDQSIQDFERVSQIATGGLRFIRAIKRGKRLDERFLVLMQKARLAWEIVLQRDFKLDWTSDNQPVTAAACYCFDVARAVDPAIEARKIQRAARLASEEAILSQLLA
ncbi:hypothetical protein N9O61_02945 [Octadecabacter sp.]|nr:hypothetical protein [Octadecabacter sp.]